MSKAIVSKAIVAAAFFAMIASAASASTLYLNDGLVIDFSTATVGSTNRVNFEFSLGETGRDENLNFIIGPTITRISGPKKTLFIDSVMCEELGIGLVCFADAVFRPKSRKDFFATYDVSAIINFEEIHDQEQPNVNEFSDSFRVNLLGTGIGIAAVPLPSAAWGLLSALGLLGWFAGKRRGFGLSTVRV